MANQASQLLTHVPSAEEWIEGMSTTDRILLILAAISATIVFVMALIEQVFVSRYISSEAVRHYMSWIVFHLPVTAIVSSIGMFFPRSAIFMNILGICYSMICLTMIIRLMNHLFGSRLEIVRYMIDHDLKIDPNQAPFFPCFCHCIPKIRPTVASNAVNGINTASILLSVYGCEMLKKVGEDYLKRQKFARFYNFVNAVQTIYSLEKVFTDILMKYKVFDVGSIGTVDARSQYLASFAYCIQALILSFVGLYIFNPVGNALFDRYAITNSQQNVEQNLEMNPLNGP